jgi:hypothetical protein
MLRDDRHKAPQSQFSRLALPATIFGAAIAIFCFGLLAPRIFQSSPEAKPQQVAKADVEKPVEQPATNVEVAPPVPTVPAYQTKVPQDRVTQNPKTQNPATQNPPATSPSSPPTDPKYNESEAEVLTIRVQPGSTPSNSPSSIPSRTFPSPSIPTQPIPARTYPSQPVPTQPTFTPQPSFTRPAQVEIAATSRPTPESKPKLPAIQLPGQDVKDEITLHKFAEAAAGATIPADKQEATFSLDTSAAAVPKGMAMVIQKQTDAGDPVWQVSLEPLPKSESETKPAASTPDEAQPSTPAKVLAPQLLAAFRVINGELRYRWLGSTPEAAQVANCVASVRWNGKDQKLLLRTAEKTQNLYVSLSKLPPNFSTGADIPPKAESIQFVLLELAGFDETVDIEPDNGICKVGSRVKIRPNHALNVEFDLGILVRSDGLAIQPKPTFLLTENNRQEFTTEKLQSVINLTTNRIQKDIGKLQFAQSRLRDIPSEFSRLSSINAQAAVKAAALVALQREAKSSDSTVKSLSVSIPKSQEVLQQLDHYRKYAEQLDGRLRLRGKLVAIADTAEIPLWIAE